MATRKAGLSPHPDPTGAQLRSAEVGQGWLPDAVAPQELEMISEGV